MENAISIRIEIYKNLCGQLLVRHGLVNELHTIDFAIVVRVHCLYDRLCLVGDNSVKYVFGSRDETILVIVGSIEYSCPRFQIQVIPIVDVLDFRMFAILILVGKVEESRVFLYLLKTDPRFHFCPEWI